MRIAICDDEIADIAVLRAHIASHPMEHEVTEYASAIPLMKHIEEKVRYDVVFLDIQMPDADGWAIAKQLKQSKIRTYIAIVSVMNDRMQLSFDRADWFASKPVTEERIHQILDHAREKLYPKALSVVSDGITVTVGIPEIYYIEVRGNYIFIHTLTEVYRVRESLSGIKRALSDFPCFAHTHKSYIINLEHYFSIEAMEIVMYAGKRVPLSRNHKRGLIDALMEYGRREFR
jgi:DNA-binding LytR/AlgR family response regulator